MERVLKSLREREYGRRAAVGSHQDNAEQARGVFAADTRKHQDLRGVITVWK